MKSQGSFEYLIILIIIIFLALIIINAISSAGLIDMSQDVREDLSKIDNLLRDVSITYAINQLGIVQVALKAQTEFLIMVHNFTINKCAININETIINDWSVYAGNCSEWINKGAGQQYEYEYSLRYIDSKGVNHSDTGLCVGVIEQ